MNENSEEQQTEQTEAGWLASQAEAITTLRADGDTSKARGEDGRFTSQKPDAETGDDTEPSSEDSEPAEVDADDLDKALAALRRGNVPPDIIDGLKESNPSKIVEWGQKIAEQQGHTDGLGNRNKELEAQLAKLTLANKADTEPGQPDSEPAELKSLLESVESDYGDQLSKPLGEITKHFQGEMKRQADDNEARLKKLENTTRDTIRSTVRPGLEERFPKAKAQSQWDAVCRKAEGLLSSGQSENEESSLNDAATLLFAGDLLSDQKAHKKVISDAKVNGQPAAGSKVHTERPATMDGHQKNEQALKMIREGKTVEEVNQWKAQQA